MKEYLTLYQLHKSGMIWWIKSLPTLKKLVLKDKETNNLLKTIVKKEKSNRYYFKTENVLKYVKEEESKKETKEI